jgi:thiol-disulfide isomerase/thioredoxin
VSEKGGEGERGVAGRRTLGPAPRPGSRYSIIVGLAFLALVIVAFASTVTSGGGGVLGLEKESSDLPLPEFAVPDARGSVDGDANVYQDDFSSAALPCPADQRRAPACRIHLGGTIRVCDYFQRPLVISFWFTKGGDCETQQDVVSAVSQRYRGRVNFLSIDIRDSRDTVRGLLRERHWRMPVGFDRDGAVSNIYRVGGCPTIVYAYPGGILRNASIGQLDAGQLSAKVDGLLAASRRLQAGER